MKKSNYSINKLLSIFVAFSIIMTTLFTGNIAYADTEAIFPDANLDAAMHQWTGIANGSPIMVSDLQNALLTHSYSIYFSNKNISSLEGMQNFEGLPLKVLELGDNNLSSLSPIANLTSLENIDISYANITDLKLQSISNLTNLKSLSIQHNEISSLSPLLNMNALKQLNAENNRITDISALAGKSISNSLNLNQNRITDISVLAPMTISSVFSSVQYNFIDIFSGINQTVASKFANLLPQQKYVTLDSSYLPSNDLSVNVGESNNFTLHASFNTTDGAIFNNPGYPSTSGMYSNESTYYSEVSATSEDTSIVQVVGNDVIGVKPGETYVNYFLFGIDSTYTHQRVKVTVNAPPTGSVTVNHMGSDGTTLDTESFTDLALGNHTYNAKTFAGYTLNGAASQTVTLTAGNLNQIITFIYDKNPDPTGSVTVNHMGSDGTTLDTESFTGLALGNHTYNAKTFAGYTLNGAVSQTVTLTAGSLNQIITFNYDKDPDPTGSVTVKYIGSDGTTLDTESFTGLTLGNHTYNAKTFTGYTLNGAASQTVTLTVGNLNQTIIFNYDKDPNPTGSVTVKHIGSDGTTLDTENFTNLALGDHTYSAKTFTGYTLNGAVSQTVTLSAGNLNQTITFNYNKNSSTTVTIPTNPEPTVTGSVTVNHKGSDGATLGTENFTGLALGNHTYNAKTFTGYTLNGAASQAVTLTASNRNQVITFNYDKNIIQPDPKPDPEPKPEPTILGTVKGRVLNDNGTPISNVRLELHSELHYTYTDKDGYYEFKNVSLGEHTISIKDDKFQQKAKNMKELKIIVQVDEKNNIEVKRVNDSNKAYTGITLDDKNREKEIDFVVIPKIPENIKKLPKTGEQDNNSELILMIILAGVLSVACIGDSIRKRKRKGLIK